MSEKPIIFNSVEVRSILEGRKSQTRRPVKPQPPVNFSWLGWITSSTDKKREGRACWNDGDLSIQEAHYSKPLYQPGDILYVKETWARLDCGSCEGDFTGKCQSEPDKNDGCYMYRATHYITGDARWKPSIHMPRKSARIFLKVTGVRVERLQDITEEDARAEGIDWLDDACYSNNGWKPTFYDPDSGGEPILKDGFISLWDSIYAKRGHPFNSNSWVWVIEFERVKP